MAYTGAVGALTLKDRPVAVVDSATEDGHIMTRSLQNGAHIHEYADNDGIPGLLQPGHLGIGNESEDENTIVFIQGHIVQWMGKCSRRYFFHSASI